MPVKKIKLTNFSWVHISDINGQDVGYLESRYRFHHLDFKDCLEGVQRPKIDAYKNYFFMIFHFPTFDGKFRRVGVCPLYVFLGKNYLITACNARDDFLDNFFLRFKKQKKNSHQVDSFRYSSAYLLYKIIDVEFRRSLQIINEIGTRLISVEEEVYSNLNKEATTNLAMMRRNILNVRRILEPQLKTLDRLVDMKSSMMPKQLSVYFDDVDDYVENMWSALESYRDSVDSLYHTNESFINQRTNDVIKMLTTISVALLPLTLLASIYGMNVVGLPFSNHPVGLWIIFIIMIGIVAGSFYFAKKRNVI